MKHYETWSHMQLGHLLKVWDCKSCRSGSQQPKESCSMLCSSPHEICRETQSSSRARAQVTQSVMVLYTILQSFGVRFVSTLVVLQNLIVWCKGADLRQLVELPGL